MSNLLRNHLFGCVRLWVSCEMRVLCYICAQSCEFRAVAIKGLTKDVTDVTDFTGYTTITTGNSYLLYPYERERNEGHNLDLFWLSQVGVSGQCGVLFLNLIVRVLF